MDWQTDIGQTYKNNIMENYSKNQAKYIIWPWSSRSFMSKFQIQFGIFIGLVQKGFMSKYE